MICLRIDEMLDILEHTKHPGFDRYKLEVEGLAMTLGHAVAGSVRELEFSGKASFEGSDFAGTCATFSPKEPGPVPAVLEHFDFEVQEWKDMCLGMAEKVQLQDQP